MEDEKSIHQMLLEAGFRHEGTDKTNSSGEHRITRISDGEVIGYMTAHRAVEFLHSLGQEPAAAAAE
jgi:hypothetical protein